MTMPVVGMRRSPRVFGVVKRADAARVLRSGRRLWPESGEGKTKRGDNGDEWSKLDKTGGKGDGFRRGGVAVKTKQEVAVMNGHKNRVGLGMIKPKKKGHCLNEANGHDDRMFGIVYNRKRKRKRFDADAYAADYKMLGLNLGGKWRRSKISDSEEGKSGSRAMLSAVVNPSCGKNHCFSSFLLMVLRYVKMARLTMEELSAVVLAEPIYGTFASQGIRFLQGPPTVNIGICQFFGITGFTPLFCVDFSAVPLCFKYLYSMMLIRSMFRPFFRVNNLASMDSDVEVEIAFPEFQNELQILCDSFEREPSENGIVKTDVIEINDSLYLHSSVKGSGLAYPNQKYRITVNSGGIQRRSSHRKRKALDPGLRSIHRSNEALASGLMNGRKSNTLLTGVASCKKLRSLANGCAIKSSAVVCSTGGRNSSLCSANILVAESDKCYRVEGAIVSLEKSSREWLLTAKKDGLIICTFKAEKLMRPYSFNRFTRVIMLSLENGWKLEFANHQDWILFKGLYKDCFHRNISAPVVKFIPVPGVHEVSGHADGNGFPFHRPDTYISANGDELSRAMARRTANYDMDSEDEEWLHKFNEFQEHVSEDNFELLIDAFEKAYHRNPDFDEKSVANGCQDLGNEEAVEAVFSYWMRKQKQKCSLLLRVFQVHQSKRVPIIPKPLMQKRRSFKRQPSQFGRAKQQKVMQASAAKQDAFEENAAGRIEAAKASANASMELAIQKRRRAQTLSKNADLAIYKAIMLIRIAEAAQGAESADASAECFLE